MTSNKNYKKFLLLWAGELISSIGGGLTSFGLGVYVFEQTGSAAGMALVTLCAFLPMLLLSIPAGILADRFDRRLMMMIGDGCSGLGIAFILFCMMTGGASLTQICIGMVISSAFSALLEPAYRATISDLLTKDEYSKASGLVSLAGSSRYLISPMIAGFLLAFSNVKLLLMIDIGTFILTVIAAAIVRHGLEKKPETERKSVVQDLKDGWHAVNAKKGMMTLILVSAAITLFMSVLQVLVEPFILSFSTSKVLGILETVCASGMLVSGVFLGIRGIKKNFVRVLGIALICAGIGMFGLGLVENPIVIGITGFIFFASLPFANNSLDYLTRVNIPEELQGRAWGFIGFISQLGCLVAYALSGVVADLIGNKTGLGVGFGSSLSIKVAGICLIAISTVLLFLKSLRSLEK